MRKLKLSILISLVTFAIFFFVENPLFAKEKKRQNIQIATFAGGCFWCMEHPFEKLDGVYSVTSGYIGGHIKNPTYKQVSAGGSGHIEAVEISFNSNIISYKDLLQVLWRSMDPTDAGGQFVDRGAQYASAIFYHNKNQKMTSEKSIKDLTKSKRFKKPIVTPIRKASVFYKAEKYHQDYYKKSPIKYKYYRFRSGRDEFIDKVWGDEREYIPKSLKQSKYTKPGKKEIRKKLSSLQYKVTQEDGTEPAFDNKYWNNKKPGIYIDIVSGEPLFSSTDKFKSGTGWPSFTKPLEKEHIVEIDDTTFFVKRTSLSSKFAGSHLGHVFNDGPKPTGLRYCINSASLNFVPVEELEENGLGEYLSLFGK